MLKRIKSQSHGGTPETLPGGGNRKGLEGPPGFPGNPPTALAPSAALPREGKRRERFLKLPHHTLVQLSQLARTEKCPALIPVYLALLYHADSHGRCFPGYHRIMEISGVQSETTVSRALKILQKEGFILVAHSHGKYGPNRYLLKLHLLENKTPITGALNSNHWSLKLQLLEPQTPINGDELYPINYTQLTIPKELYSGERERERVGEYFVKGREKRGREKPFGPPDDPALDREYYRL